VTRVVDLRRGDAMEPIAVVAEARTDMAGASRDDADDRDASA
jgi:hypothetical protein